MKPTPAQKRVLERLQRGALISEMLGYYQIAGGVCPGLNMVWEGLQPATVQALLRQGWVEKQGTSVRITGDGVRALGEEE